MIMSKREAPTEYSYGWGRLEVMSAFTNACFLIFVCVFTIIETFHTLYKPGDIHSDSLVMASCGLAVNAIGIALFCKYATLSSTSDVISPHQLTLQVQRYRNSGSTQDGSIVDRSRFNNLHSVYLHVFADILSHSGLLLAAWIINAKGWLLAHPVLVIGISLVVMRSAYPLFDMARMVLLQTVDPALQQGLQRCIREISFRDGVLECRSAHWWSNAPGVTVGSLHIRVRTDADEQDILLYAHGLLKKYVMHITVQIEKDRPVTWLMK